MESKKTSAFKVTDSTLEVYPKSRASTSVTFCLPVSSIIDKQITLQNTLWMETDTGAKHACHLKATVIPDPPETLQPVPTFPHAKAKEEKKAKSTGRQSRTITPKSPGSDNPTLTQSPLTFDQQFKAVINRIQRIQTHWSEFSGFDAPSEEEIRDVMGKAPMIESVDEAKPWNCNSRIISSPYFTRSDSKEIGFEKIPDVEGHEIEAKWLFRLHCKNRLIRVMRRVLLQQRMMRRLRKIQAHWLDSTPTDLDEESDAEDVEVAAESAVVVPPHILELLDDMEFNAGAPSVTLQSTA